MPSRSSRYIRHDRNPPPEDALSAIKDEILDALYSGVRRVHRHSSSSDSIYVGGGGTLLMDWRVAAIPDMQEYLPSRPSLPRSLVRPTDGSHVSFLETSVGTASLHLLIQMRRVASVHREISREGWEPCVHLITQAFRASMEEHVDEHGCEVLYGRAGLLYALMLLRSEFHRLMDGSDAQHSITEAVNELVSTHNLSLLVQDIITRGQIGAENYAATLSSGNKDRAPPLMWNWHGKRYLGGAHGVAGILQMLVSVPTDVLEPHWDLIIKTLRWLVDVQLPSGNWPSRAGRHMHEPEDEDERYQLIQWCHGAPGVLILLSRVIDRFASQTEESTMSIPEELLASLRVSLERGGEIVYRHGFLRKGVGICHGVAGSVFTLLAISRVLDPLRSAGDSEGAQGEGEASHDHSGEGEGEGRIWLRRAVHLAQLATTYFEREGDGEMSVPDRPYSLYEGVAGMCCAWADVLKRLEGGVGIGMPGYDDLGSPR